jgi:hypothetical protein
MASQELFEQHLVWLKDQFDQDIMALRELHGDNSESATRNRIEMMHRIVRFERLISRFERYLGLLEFRDIPSPPALRRQDGHRRPLRDVTNQFRSN